MNPIRKTIVGVSILGATLGGAALGAATIGSASAATGSAATTATASSDTSSATAATPAAPAPTDSSAKPSGAPPTGQAPDPSKGGHTANGITETVLTGDDATKATTAATAAVPGGTIDRVETDAEGATYEAHVTKSDGSKVTVKLNADFTVKSIDNGMS